MKKLMFAFLSLLILCVFSTPASAGWRSWWKPWTPPAPHSNKQLSVEIKQNTTRIIANDVDIFGNAVNYGGLKKRVVALEGIYSMTVDDINKISQEVGVFSSDIAGLQAQITDLTDRLDASIATSEYNIPVTAAGNYIGMMVGTLYGSIVLKFNDLFEEEELTVEGKFVLSPYNILAFKNSNCEGEVYVFAVGWERPVNFNLKPEKGKIYDYNGIIYYYPPKESTVYKTNILSYYNSGNCHNYTSPRLGYYFKVLPNDPAVTGIDIYPFPLPIVPEGLEQVTIISD